jgi:hypothetical protein
MAGFGAPRDNLRSVLAKPACSSISRIRLTDSRTRGSGGSCKHQPPQILVGRVRIKAMQRVIYPIRFESVIRLFWVVKLPHQIVREHRRQLGPTSP